MQDYRRLVQDVHTIAVVGFSLDPSKAGFVVPEYLHDNGFRIIAVNPSVQDAWGEKAYASLTEIPDPVELVLVFRRPEFCPGVVQDALAMTHRPKIIWLQIGITSAESKALAEHAGVIFVQNRCLMVLHQHLFH